MLMWKSEIFFLELLSVEIMPYADALNMKKLFFDSKKRFLNKEYRWLSWHDEL